MIRLATITLALLYITISEVRAEGYGELEFTAIAYPENAFFQEQDDAAVQAELSTTWKANFGLGDKWDSNIAIFSRANPTADATVAGDVREATLSFYGTHMNALIGVLNEHWGVLEAANLVDVINQRDLVEDIDGDVKLGQPGASLTWLGDNGQVQLFLLPYLRERRLAENADRFWTAEFPYADAQYENNRARPALAARATAYASNIEFSISHYWGYAREPRLEIELDADGQPDSLVPNYDLMHQTGLEAQLISGDTIWKTEAFYRMTNSSDLFSIGMGLERKFEKFLGTRASITPYFEIYYDNRDAEAPRTAFDRDAFIGARLAFNDIEDTEIKLNVLADWENNSALIEIEGGRRLSDNWKISIDALAPVNVENDRALETLRNDARLRLHITRYF